MAALCFSDFPYDSNAFIPKVPNMSVFLHKVQQASNWLFSTGALSSAVSSQILLNLHLPILDESNVNRNNINLFPIEVAVF